MENSGKTYRIDNEALDYIWYEMDIIIHKMLAIRGEDTILKKFNAFSILKYAYNCAMFTNPSAVTNVNTGNGRTHAYNNIDCWFFLLLKGLNKLFVVVERTCGRTVFNELMEASSINERLDIVELMYVLGRRQGPIYVLEEDTENMLFKYAIDMYIESNITSHNILRFLYATAYVPYNSNDIDHDRVVTRFLGKTVLYLYILSRYAKHALAYHYCINTIKYKRNYWSVNNLHHTSDIKMKRLLHNRANCILTSMVDNIADDSEASAAIFNYDTFRSNLYSTLKTYLEDDKFRKILDNYTGVRTVYIYGKEPVTYDGLYTRKVVEDVLIEVDDKR